MDFMELALMTVSVSALNNGVKKMKAEIKVGTKMLVLGKCVKVYAIDETNVYVSRDKTQYYNIQYLAFLFESGNAKIL